LLKYKLQTEERKVEVIEDEGSEEEEVSEKTETEDKEVEKENSFDQDFYIRIDPDIQEVVNPNRSVIYIFKPTQAKLMTRAEANKLIDEVTRII